MKFDKKTQLSIAYAILTLLLLLSLQNYFSTQVENVPYSQFRHWVQDGQVQRCTFIGEFIQGRVLIGGVDGNFRTVAINDPELLSLLEENQVEYTRESDNNWFTQLLSWILPAVFFVGICYGFYLVITRKLSTSDNSLLTLLFTGVVGLAIISVFIPSVWINPTLNEWIMMAIIGLIASVAHLFIILSLKYADASKLAPLGYTEIITNIIISYYFFHELPDNWTYLGLFVIVLSGLYISRREYYLNKIN